MTHEIHWLIKDRVIFEHLWGDVTIEEGHETSAKLAEMVRAGKPLVHMIIDMRGVTKVPISLNQLNGAMVHTKEPNCGWSVVIGGNRVIQFLASTITQLARARFRVVGSMEEAIQFVQQQDISLAGLPIESVVTVADDPSGTH